MSKLSTCLKSLVAAAALTGAVAAVATPIVGTAQLTFGRVLITPFNIDFNNVSTNINPPPNGSPTFGRFLSDGSGNDGSFAALPFSNQNFVHDLSQLPVPDANNFAVGSTPAGLADMFKFDTRTTAAGDSTHWMFTATGLATGSTINSIVTPYLLSEQFSGGSVSTGAQITLTGWACDDVNKDNVCQTTEDRTNWVATISAQYPGFSIAQLTALLSASPFALPNNTWSGTLTATRLPEPASLALVGLALAGLGFASRRRQAK